MSEQLGPDRTGDRERPESIAATVAADAASKTAPGDETSPHDALACTELFIWPEGAQDVDHDAASDLATAEAVALLSLISASTQGGPPDGPRSDHETPEDVVRRMDQLLEDEVALSRIATALAPHSPASDPVHEETWRQQFLSALRSVDRDTARPPARSDSPSPVIPKGKFDATDTVPLANATPPALYFPPSPANALFGSSLAPFAQRVAQMYGAASRVIAPQRHIVLAAGTVIAVTGVVSAAIPQIANLSAPPVRPANLASSFVEKHRQAAADGEIPRQPMLNTPVLVREGTIGARAMSEAIASAPSFAAPRRVQSVPVHEPARLLMPPPIEAPSPSADQAAAGATSVDPRAVKMPTAAAVPPPIDRAGLTDLVSPSAAPDHRAPPSPPATEATKPPEHEAKARASSTPRRTKPRAAATRKQTRTSTAARTPANSHWESRRQGLRTTAPPQQQEEPSTLVKLLGSLWPGKADGKPQPK